jgi:3'-phosphoadenosine 5'-phosphosulfate sulfotransferase (PAPS reductase)/FAD synthetase
VDVAFLDPMVIVQDQYQRSFDEEKVVGQRRDQAFERWKLRRFERKAAAWPNRAGPTIAGAAPNPAG